MKVLMLNGSPRKNGNTALALQEMKKVFDQQGIEAEIVHVGGMDIRSCIACGRCGTLGRCVFDDVVNQLHKKMKQADGLVLGSPVYYAGANPTLMALMTRLAYSANYPWRMKVGASVVIARRGGCTAAFDEMNKFFTISGMPVASSTYWNMAHGGAPGEVQQDAEGLQTMRNLARNMAFLMKSIALGKEAYGLPEQDRGSWTNFIR